jgi:hypothetical protein
MGQEPSRGGKKRGRPPVGATPVNVRMPPGELAALDNWIKTQPRGLSRAQALRRLALAGLASAPIKQAKNAAGEKRPASTRQSGLVCNQE